MKAAVFFVALTACVSAYVDRTAGAQCEDWVMSNQKNMVIVNQVAEHSEIGSCAEYCTVVGSGWRADMTTCRGLCEQAGGYKSFSQALTLDGGMAAPTDICKRVFNPVDADEPVSLLQVSVEAEPSATAERKIGIRGDLTVQGTLVASVLTSPIGDVRMNGDLNVANSIESNSAHAASIKARSHFTVSHGIQSKKDQLLIKARIDADSVTADDISASFLEVGGVRQWALHSLEDFEEVGVDGWSHGEITECGGHKILGGHCVEKATPELTKTFDNLPEHSQIRISAKYMFIDSWDGESGYLKVNDNTVWVESYNHADGDAKHGINVCGNSTPERKLSSPIDVTIPHTGSSITLSFGATTDEHSCDESFGIDSVMVFVR